MLTSGTLAIRSYSRLLALEAARILFRLGCDVRVYDPTSLPVKDDEQHSHEKVQELRQLSRWSDGHIWVSPEQHGNVVSRLFCVNLTKATCPNMVGSQHLNEVPDCCLQESDRLDPSLNRLGSTNTRPDAGNCSSLGRFSVFQHCQYLANPRALDAHVYYTQSELNTQSIHTIHGCAYRRHY